MASGLLPERAGVPVKVWAHIFVGDVMDLAGSSALMRQWVADARAAWAAHRAAGSEGGGDGGVWLRGDAAAGMACDGSVAPVVSGAVNPGAFYRLVQLATELADLGYLGRHPAAPGQPAAGGQPGSGQSSEDGQSSRDGQHAGSGHMPGDGSDPAGATSVIPAGSAAPDGGTIVVVPAVPGAEVLRRWEALEQAIVAQAVELMSGPGGLISYVRRGMFAGRLGGPSIPLDVGYSETIPAGIRHAVRLRDGHCAWPGGCSQPAPACQVHHTTHKARGGTTSLRDCVLLCFYHHQVVIHRLGWTLVLNPDGTTTAWNNDHTKTLHSHGPPPSRE
ncbi:MAG: HNH endonuclease signature motif containing protein [Streptosporangiaceae bacterium]